MSVGIAVLFVSAAFARERPAVPRLAVSEAPVPDVYVLADGTPVWVLPDPDAALVRIEVSMLEGHLHAADPAALQMAGALLGAAPAGGLARWNAQLDGAGGVAALGTGALRSWVDLEVLAGHEVDAVRLGRDAALRARFPWRDVRAIRAAWRETSATDWRSDHASWMWQRPRRPTRWDIRARGWTDRTCGKAWDLVESGMRGARPWLHRARSSL